MHCISKYICEKPLILKVGLESEYLISCLVLLEFSCRVWLFLYPTQCITTMG